MPQYRQQQTRSVPICSSGVAKKLKRKREKREKVHYIRRPPVYFRSIRNKTVLRCSKRKLLMIPHSHPQVWLLRFGCVWWLETRWKTFRFFFSYVSLRIYIFNANFAIHSSERIGSFLLLLSFYFFFPAAYNPLVKFPPWRGEKFWSGGTFICTNALYRSVKRGWSEKKIVSTAPVLHGELQQQCLWQWFGAGKKSAKYWIAKISKTVVCVFLGKSIC